MQKCIPVNRLHKNVEYPGFFCSFKTCRSGVLIVPLKSKRTTLFTIYVQIHLMFPK